MGIQINGQTDTISAVDNNFSLAGNVSIGGTLTYEDVTSVDAVGLSTFQAGIHVTGGLVGIGTNNPAEALEVYGDARFKAPDGSHGIELFSDIGSLGYQRIISWNRTTSVYENLSIGANDLIIGPNFERLRITSAGLVGIGITNPDKKLVIAQANSTAYSGTDFDQDYHVLKLNNTTDSKTVGMQFLIGSNGEAAITATEASDGATDLIFGTRGGGSRAERLRITSGGNVGIGTVNPFAKLHVNITSPTSVPAAGSNNHPVVIGNVGFGAAIGALNTGESYIQGTRWDGTATNYSLLLNPNGGNVGIGTNNPSELLHLQSGHTKQILKSTNLNTASSVIFDVANVNTADFLLGQLAGRWNGTDVAYINFEAGADTTNKDDGIITFLTSASGGSPTERLRITSAGHLTIPYQPRFSAYEGIQQTASGSAYKIEFSSANVNIGGHYSTSNDRFTAPVAGDYYFMYRVMSGTATYLRCQFKVNGSYVLDQFFSEAVTYANNVGSMIYTLSVGDYVEVWCDVGNNSQGTIHGGYRCFVGYLVG